MKRSRYSTVFAIPELLPGLAPVTPGPRRAGGRRRTSLPWQQRDAWCMARPGSHDGSPRDRFITLYGRKPVLEALADRAVEIDKVVLAENATGAAAREIVEAASARGVALERASAQRVKLLAGNG